MKNKIDKALDKIRPMLKADGGNVELVNFDEKSGTVKVKLTGICRHCPNAEMTLKQGIEVILKKEVPEVKSVVAV